MLSQDILKKYAEVLWWGLTTARNERYKKGDVVLVRYDAPATGAAEEMFSRLLSAGMMPVVRATHTTNMEKRFYEVANSKQLAYTAPGDKELFENVNGGIYLLAPDSLTHLSHVDPARIGAAAVARKHLRDILDEREQEGVFGWTLGIVPTQALARHARMSLASYTEQWLIACNLNHEDPVGRWEKVYSQAQKVKKWLNSMDIDQLHVKSANTDLLVSPGRQRQWIGISGHNIPSYEIFLSPDWRGTEGVYFANQPSFRQGNLVKGVRLEFSGGKVVSVAAKAGEDFVNNQVAMDNGACRLGEFSLTDRRFSPINKFMANTLFDENFGGRFGNCHVALGSSYADTFAGNGEPLTAKKKKELGFNDSALHWDLVNTEKKTVTARMASGKSLVIYDRGEFQIPAKL